MKISRTFVKSPIGNLEVLCDEIGICAINLAKNYEKLIPQNRNLRLCVEQLNEYFAGNLRKFELNLHINGSEFEKQVYMALCEIPYGKTATYAEIARQIGRAKAYRAVGNANRKNKIPIIIPCHRVLGANSLGGYSLNGKNALNVKKFLLNLESKFS